MFRNSWKTQKPNVDLRTQTRIFPSFGRNMAQVKQVYVLLKYINSFFLPSNVIFGSFLLFV